MVHSSDRLLAGVDLNLLLVLRALLSERHVTRAAARVGLSQSATSHALARLREQYADQLLVRNGRQLVLTPRAQRLLPALERGLGDLRSALDDEPAFEPSTAQRCFNLGMADYGQAISLAPLLRHLSDVAPRVDLSVSNFPNLEELLTSGGLDLAMHVRSSPGLSSELLFSDGFTCVVRRDHPVVRKRLTLKRYVELDHVLVAPQGAPGSLVDTALEQRGLSRRIALRVSSFLVAPIVVSQTDFISTMPRRLALQLVKRYPLRLLPPPLDLPTFDVSLLWHPRFDADPAHMWLRGVLGDIARKS